jgi:hypothetical protein
MPKKLDIKEIHSLGRRFGFILKDSEYRGVMEYHSWLCSEGHLFQKRPNSIKSGSGCPKCARHGIPSQASFDRIREVAARRGYTLTETEYRGSSTKHGFRCSAGHEFRMLTKNFTKGKGRQSCPVCVKASRSKYTEIERKLARTIRARLSHVLRRGNHRKEGSAVRDLGCSVPELRAYLESKFQPGMTWSNRGTRGWHVDHVRAMANFDLTDPEQQRQAVHYTNLQPLWWFDNLAKGARLEWKGCLTWT